jgi:hypothetical protein
MAIGGIWARFIQNNSLDYKYLKNLAIAAAIVNLGYRKANYSK